MQKPKEYICTIEKIIQETPTVKTFRLELPKDKTIDFLPGQFVMISLLNVGKELEKIKRAYSITNQPKNSRYIEITLDAHGPFTQKMFTLKDNDQVKAFGPYGRFTIQLNTRGNIALFGGGTGIVPLMCMLRYLTDNNLKNQVSLMYSSKLPEEIIFRKELVERSNKYPSFKYFQTITRLKEKERWHGHTGRITKEYIFKSIPDISERFSYICGSKDFVKSINNMLKQLDVKNEKIKDEVWNTT